ncbi:H-NS histone family protein, partial [Nostoc sp. NIES-2111]
ESEGDDTAFAISKLPELSPGQLSLLLVLLAIDSGPVGDHQTYLKGRLDMARSFGIDPLKVGGAEAEPRKAEATSEEPKAQEQLQLDGLPPPPPEEEEEDEPAPAAKQPAKGSKATLVRYRNPATGETWSGRGLQPKWLKAAIAAGNKLTDYAVEAVAA